MVVVARGPRRCKTSLEDEQLPAPEETVDVLLKNDHKCRLTERVCEIKHRGRPYAGGMRSLHNGSNGNARPAQQTTNTDSI